MEKRTFPCPFCEAAFTSKTQLEKHRLWNHLDRPLPAAAAPVENRSPKVSVRGKKRYWPAAFEAEKRESSLTLWILGWKEGVRRERPRCLKPRFKPALYALP